MGRHHSRTILVLALSVALIASVLTVTAVTGQTEDHTFTEETTESRLGDITIDMNVCKPAAADQGPVPLIVHSHGWGGSKSGCSSFGSYLDAGFAVVSFSQRGFGETGGEAHVEDPHYEAQDTMAVIDHMATKPWILKDSDPNGDPIPDDPVMGAIGGSYGGGFQTIGALQEINETGETRFDALAPEITWHDLPESLAPNGVIRSLWVDVLYAAGAANVHDGIHEAFVVGAATGQLPNGSIPGTYNIVQDFYGNSPVWFSDHGIQLDIPVLIGQGITDNLFNLNEGWHNFEDVLDPDAREASYFVGYNDGHALPSVLPRGGPGSVAQPADRCTTEAGYTSFDDLVLAFMENKLKGAGNPMPSSTYNLATADNQSCLHAETIGPTGTVELGLPLVTPTGAGAPVYIPVAQGPVTLAGIPTLSGDLVSAGVDQRAFIGLAVGTTPADAELLSNNLMPVRSFLPGVQEGYTTELAGISADLQPGQTLYLVVTATADQFVHHGSRVPGGLVLQDASLGLPILTS